MDEGGDKKSRFTNQADMIGDAFVRPQPFTVYPRWVDIEAILIGQRWMSPLASRLSFSLPLGKYSWHRISVSVPIAASRLKFRRRSGCDQSQALLVERCI